ncbi:protogenin B-like [Ptychodera flava]|uniref:protogenin B-like n=1 Tax=Ptychodera flava TaxID=63121 RepID=UPI00396A29A6
MAHQPSDLRSWLILFLLILLSIGAFGAKELNFTLEPDDVVVLKGQAFVWNCAAEGSIPFNITWRKDGQVIKDDDNRNVLRNGSLSFAAIQHKKKKILSDEGTYQCCISSEIGTIVSKSAVLQVASKPKFSVQPKPVRAEIGRVARFSCFSDSIPQSAYTWEKDRTALPLSTRYVVLPSGILQIHNIQASDAGSYRCTAENIANRRRSDEASLAVELASTAVTSGNAEDPERKPQIVAGPQNITVLAGSHVVLECLADRGSSTDPLPEVTWSREGMTLSIGDRVSYTGLTNLKIEDLMFTDSGVYVCTAKNPDTGAVIHAKGKLDVHSPPKLIGIPPSKTRPVGSTARFSCEAEGKPQPSISWLKNGEPVHINGRINQVKLQGDLVISGVRSSPGDRDDAFYQCVITNIHGQVQASASLKVVADGNSPSVPENLRGYALSSTSLLINWTPSQPPAGETILAYSVHYTPATEGRAEGRELQEAIDPDTTTYIIDNLEPNTNYLVYVTPYTTSSVGEKSETINVKTGEDVPEEAPVFTLSSNSPTSIIVAWEPLPEKLSNGEITAYYIYYRQRGTAGEDIMININKNANEFILGGLQPSTMYSIRMSAVTSAGEGVSSPYSDKRTADLQDSNIPPAPKLELEKLNTTAIKIMWTIPNFNSISVEGFQLYFSEGDNVPVNDPIQLSSDRSLYIFTGLKPSTRYYVKLQADYDNGYSNDASGDIETEVPPPRIVPAEDTLTPPVDLKAEVQSSTSAMITWVQPPQATNIKILFFTVRFQPVDVINASAIRWEEIDGESVVLTNLSPFTKYQITVRAHGRNGHGPYSDALLMETFQDKPSSPPSNVKITVADVQTVLLQWAPPEHPNGVITTYVIMYNWDVEEPEDTWSKNEEGGWMMNSTVGGLKPSLGYYFKMTARTKAGEGPATEPLHVRMPAPGLPTTSIPASISQNTKQKLPTSGIIVGVAIGLGCIIVCTAIIVYRGRHGLLQLCKPSNCHVAAPTCNGHIPHSHGNGYIGRDYGKPQNEVELESFTPMLTQLPAPTNLDTKGGNGTLINGYGPVGCHGSNHLHHGTNLHHQPPGSSNTSISASTSSSSSPPINADTAPDESLDSSKIPEENETMLTNLSSCHGDGEETDAMRSNMACNAANHDTKCCCSPSLPQSSLAGHVSSSLPAQEEITGTSGNPRKGQADVRQAAALLQNSPTQGHRGNLDVNHCHSNSDCVTSPLLQSAEDTSQDSTLTSASNNSSTPSAGSNNIWEKRSPVPHDDTHLHNFSGSDSNSPCNTQETDYQESADRRNGLSGDENDSNASQDTSPYFIELALNM